MFALKDEYSELFKEEASYTFWFGAKISDHDDYKIWPYENTLIVKCGESSVSVSDPEESYDLIQYV